MLSFLGFYLIVWIIILVNMDLLVLTTSVIVRCKAKYIKTMYPDQ